jgi:hypothetical protein
MSSPYEKQQAAEARRRHRNGRVARDLAAYINERDPYTASDFQDTVEQWLRDNGGYDRPGHES